MQYERDVLTRVTEARAAYAPSAPIPDQAATSEATTAAVRSLFAVVERYPDIKAAANVQDLQDEIERLEGMIADRRELYNDQVYRYNTRIGQVPGVILAPVFRLAASRVLRGGSGRRHPARHRPSIQLMADDVWLVRHGETDWARLGRHTGRTDIPLTDIGRAQARALGRRLAGHPFALVLTSPLSRAAETTSLAGFGSVAVADPDLQEWDYGELEGRAHRRHRQVAPRVDDLAWAMARRRDPRRRRRPRGSSARPPQRDRWRRPRRGPRSPPSGAHRPLARAAAGVGRALRSRDRHRVEARSRPRHPGHRGLERGLPPRLNRPRPNRTARDGIRGSGLG